MINKIIQDQVDEFEKEYNFRLDLLKELRNNFNDSLEEHYIRIEELISAAYIFNIINTEQLEFYQDEIDEIYYAKNIIIQL